MRVRKITKPVAGWPKHQVRARYEERGAKSAMRLAKRLGIARHRVMRWLSWEFVVSA